MKSIRTRVLQMWLTSSIQIPVKLIINEFSRTSRHLPLAGRRNIFIFVRENCKTERNEFSFDELGSYRFLSGISFCGKNQNTFLHRKRKNEVEEIPFGPQTKNENNRNCVLCALFFCSVFAMRVTESRVTNSGGKQWILSIWTLFRQIDQRFPLILDYDRVRVRVSLPVVPTKQDLFLPKHKVPDNDDTCIHTGRRYYFSSYKKLQKKKEIVFGALCFLNSI